MKRFTLMSTEHCHLCEQAEMLIVQQVDGYKYIVEVEDIAVDDLLIARYGIRIPVLVDEQTKAELNWPFDQESLAAFVQ